MVEGCRKGLVDHGLACNETGDTAEHPRYPGTPFEPLGAAELTARRFYRLLSLCMNDWKQRKQIPRGFSGPQDI